MTRVPLLFFAVFAGFSLAHALPLAGVGSLALCTPKPWIVPKANSKSRPFEVLTIRSGSARIWMLLTEIGGDERRVVLWVSGANLRCGDPIQMEYRMGGRSEVFHSRGRTDDFLIDIDRAGVPDDGPYGTESWTAAR